MEWQGLSSPFSGGLAAADESENAPSAQWCIAGTGKGSPQVRAFFVAGAMPLAAALAALVSRAFVGGPSLACLAVLLGLAAV